MPHYLSILNVNCDRTLALKLRRKFNRTTIRPVTLCEIDYSAIKSQQENKLNLAKMRMLHWRSEHTRQDMIGMNAPKKKWM